MKEFDYLILEYIRLKIKNPIMDKIMVWITRLGDLDALWIVIALIFLSIDRFDKYGITILISLILSGLIGNLILKNIFKRKRPFDTKEIEELLISRPKDHSFPSGHTMASIAAAYVIFSADIVLGIIFMIIALLIAFSRMYLYVHYPTDVIVGAIIGILLGKLSIYIVNLDIFERLIYF